MTTAAALTAARLWRDYPRETVALGVLAAAGAALAGAAWSNPSWSGLTQDPATAAVSTPVPPPLLVREMPAQDALALNGKIGFAAGPNPAARPFALGSADAATRARALECLTSAVYYEAGSESSEGQRAVAQVVLNRVRHPVFPASVCAVVYQGSTRDTGCQFTFTCDGSLTRRAVPALWDRARKVAEAALSGAVHAPVGYATHYHANYVVPYWAPSLAKNAIVGTHIFYRWSGGWGRPPAFTQSYVRAEPSVSALRTAALLAEQRDQSTEEQEAVATIPGAEELPLTPSMRGDERVAVRFNLVARKAAEEAPRKPYVEKVAASDTLRWALTGEQPKADEAPLGRKPANDGSPAAGASGAAGK